MEKTPLNPALKPVEKPKKKPHRDEFDFISPRLSALLGGPTQRAHWLSTIVALFIVCFFVWAYYAPLNEETKGQGKVVTATRLQTISHLEGGIVKEILVVEGDHVKKGQALLRLDTTASKAKYDEDLENYYRQLAARERVFAQIQNVTFYPSPYLQNTKPLIAQQEMGRYKARMQKHNSDIEVIKQEVNIKEGELQEARMKYKNYQDQIKVAQEHLDMLKPLADKNLTPKTELFHIQRDLMDLQNQLSLTEATIQKQQAAIQQTQDKIQQANLTFQQENSLELKDIEQRLSELAASRTAIEDRVRRAEIVSSVDGIVRELKVRTVGGTVQPGEALLDIAPDDDNLLIEVQIAPESVAYVHPGMPALVKVTSYDFAIYGGLDAVVDNISSDVIVDKHEIPTFRVILKAKRNYLVKEGKWYYIKAGMQVEADIRTGKKTVMTYLFKPFLRGIQTALSER